jgi:hypothetical protein
MQLRWLQNILQYSTIEVDDKNNSREVWHAVPRVEGDQIEVARKVMQEDKEVLDKLAKNYLGD